MYDEAKITMFFAVAVHMLACTWYLIGNTTNAGWVSDSDAQDDVVHNYLTSGHWTLTQLHGSVDIYPRSTSERGFAFATVFCAFLLHALIVARSTSAVFVLNDSSAAKMLANSRRFARFRRISMPLASRLFQYLRAQHDEGLGDMLTSEHQLMSCLPEHLQMDLCAEMRMPLMLSMQFLLLICSNTMHAHRENYVMWL